MDIVEALDQIVPSADYGGYPGNREQYLTLRWNDARPQPDYDLDIVPLLSQPRPPPPPDPNRQAPPIPSGTSIPALRDEVAALRQVLINAGILHD